MIVKELTEISIDWLYGSSNSDQKNWCELKNKSFFHTDNVEVDNFF